MPGFIRLAGEITRIAYAASIRVLMCEVESSSERRTRNIAIIT